MRISKELIKELYIHMAPLVLYPPNYGDEIPKSLMSVLPKSRKDCVSSGDFDKGMTSIADMVIYLYSASFKVPLPEEYVKIYSYYADKLFDGALRKSNIQVFELTDKEIELANELRRKILKAQLRELKRKIKEISVKEHETH